MKSKKIKALTRPFRLICLLTLAIGFGWQATAAAFTLTVVDNDGAAITSGFRWLLEEDNTNQPVIPTPGSAVAPTKSISLDIHKSYAPVASNGSSDTASAVIVPPTPNGRYALSVLPYTGYSIGGTTIVGDPAAVKVVVQDLPLPTAQISILIFQDHAPINNVPDDGELGLEGAAITLHDAAGQLMQDAFGNPLGTTYFPGTTDVDVIGNGSLRTNASGEVLVKNLTPGKYGVVVTPPSGDWIQTSTIEGTRTVDAWVKPDEPPTFVEGFGTGFYHVFIGFVNPTALPGFAPGGTGKITGNLRYNHFDRPPNNQGFHVGPPVKDCWVGLNDPVTGQGLYAAPCFDGVVSATGDEIPSSFSIPNVPTGTYEMVTWDKPLDALFGFRTVTVPGDISPTGDQVDLGTILSFRWFGSFLGTVFLDSNENGIREPDEIGLPEQNINIRFRDGTIYQAQPTDIFGGYALEEVFPFFKWLVVEVDFARFKSTGMTASIDYGGDIPAGFDENDPWGPLPKVPTFDQLNPQPQDVDNPNTGNNLSRTETGEVLTQAMHLFLNQTNVIDWGKQTYTDTENGGISGVVMYAVTRAENDPRYAAGEEWEPGIPRVQMNLYMDSNFDGVIDDLDGDGGPTIADVDNYPFDNFPGSEDVDRNGNTIFDPGDAISITTTDSFDDSQPSGCVQDLPIVHGAQIPECADSFGTWNQIRPGVFDGGYAFASYHPGGIASGSNEVEGLPSAQNYIVEATTPPGYLLLKEEDKNVDFGNELQVSTQVLPPICVGDPHTIPQYLSFQTDEATPPNLLPGIDPADAIESPYWVDGTPVERPLCDRKTIGLSAKENAAADFFFFTKVPKAARAVGFVNNDLSAEFNQGSPNFGEKAAPSWIPVSFKDWQGNEITRVYTDEFGGYNAMLPSTYTVNVPSPTGVSPNIITLVLNDPNLPDGSRDPNYNPDYSVTPWTLQYEAGRTTYLDTPLVPVAAFVNFPEGNLDAEPVNGTPVIKEVNGPELSAPEADFGPIICTPGSSGSQVTITSFGSATQVPNPDYIDSQPLSQATILRDFGFGITEGQVLLDGVDITTLGASTLDSWNSAEIMITVDTSVVTTSGVLTVVRGDNGLESESGVTLVITDCGAANVHFVTGGGVYPATPIQAAVDAANPGDLILIGKGTYDENVIMWQPVQLQGAGTTVTSIVANPSPSERLAAWHTRMRTLLGIAGTAAFTANEAPGIMVIGQDLNAYPTTTALPFTGFEAAVDGFAISGATTGSGIYVHSQADGLEITNNEIFNNQGIFAGGIVVGTPDTALDPNDPLVAPNNDNLLIKGNRIHENGGIQGAGGLAIYTGADDYIVEDNYIIGNLSRFSGAGIAHIGLSDNGTIRNNHILFNEVFYGLQQVGAGDGGGIYLAGELLGEYGAGNVTVEGNLIQGNLAGAGDGGGIRTYAFNGASVDFAAAQTHTLTIINNIIANNVAGHAGGGILLHDTANATIVNNTIVHNDSTATSAISFENGATNSTPQPAGLVVTAYSTLLATALAPDTYPDPILQNNIIWHNRSFYNDSSRNNFGGDLVFDSYWDLAVVNTGTPLDQMSINNSVLSSLTGPNNEDYTGNTTDDPGFVHHYTNNLFSATVVDEGGNAISVRFTPLSVRSGDYHLTDCSPATVMDAGVIDGTTPSDDYDGDARPDGAGVDIGADEFVLGQVDYPFLTLLSPIGGEVIPTATAYTITWGAPDNYVTFDLSYSLDNGATWVSIATGLTGTCYEWTLPELLQASDQVKIQLVGRDIDGVVIGDPAESAATLTIDIAALITPNGGETITYDSANPPNIYQINWQNPYATDSTDVISLWYRLNGNLWTMIVSGLPGDTTSYDWAYPAVTTDTTGFEVRIIIADSTFINRVVDVSDGTFTIRPAAAIAPAVPPVGPADDPVVGAEVTPPATTGGGVYFQCPDATGAQAVLSVVVDDNVYRADDGEIANPVSAQQVCMHLAAGDGLTTMADGRQQYMFGFTNVTGIPDDEVMNMWDNPTNPGGMLAANFPAPLIQLKQNDEVYLTLSNVGMMMRPDLFDPHTVHWHGFPQAASIFDGVPDASISINMGSSLTYYYQVIEPGTFMYHCHVEATEHMQMGMLGNLYVTPVQDGTTLNTFSTFAYNDGDGSTGYNKEYHLQITAFDPEFHDASMNTQPLPFALMDDKYPMINGRGYPDTVSEAVDYPLNPEGYWAQRDSALITVNDADTRVLLRISSLSTTSFHTISVLGLPMQLVGEGSRKLGTASGVANDLDTAMYRDVNSVTIGGGQSVDVLLDVSNASAGETYFLYVNNLDHLTNNDEDFGGMMTEIRIVP